MEIVWQRLDIWLRAALPAATGFIMTLMSVVVWPLPHLGPVMPPLALVALFYWSTHRPDLFPASVAFFLGLLNDIIHNLPIGISAFLFTLAHEIIWRQRRFFVGHSFFMLWSGFVLVSVVLMVLQWILVALVSWQIVPFLPILLQTILAVLFFPLPCWVLIRLQRTALSVG